MNPLPRWTGLAGMVLIAALLIGGAYWGDTAQRMFATKMQSEGNRVTATVLSKSYQAELYARPGGDYAITVDYTDHRGRRVLAETHVSKASTKASRSAINCLFGIWTAPFARIANGCWTQTLDRAWPGWRIIQHIP